MGSRNWWKHFSYLTKMDEIWHALCIPPILQLPSITWIILYFDLKQTSFYVACRIKPRFPLSRLLNVFFLLDPRCCTTSQHGSFHIPLPPPSSLRVNLFTKMAFDPLSKSIFVSIGRPNFNSPPEDSLGLSMLTLTTHPSMLLLIVPIILIHIYFS